TYWPGDCSGYIVPAEVLFDTNSELRIIGCVRLEQVDVRQAPRLQEIHEALIKALLTFKAFSNVVGAVGKNVKDLLATGGREFFHLLDDARGRKKRRSGIQRIRGLRQIVAAIVHMACDSLPGREFVDNLRAVKFMKLS